MKKISIIIPAHNEERNIPLIYDKLKEVSESFLGKYLFEIIFINDGSDDDTFVEIEKLARNDENLKYIDFSRNFGKETATSAGLNSCNGDACIMLDADLQHPVELIPNFIAKWEAGAEVVVGIRAQNKSDGFAKKIGSAIFYKIINKISEIEVVPNATDFRLLDRIVIDQFNKLTETNRMTRALIDWLGFRREYINFQANERIHGQASYDFWKLFKLAMNSFVSLSLFPLKLAGNLGLVIVFVSGISGLYILLGKYFFHTRFASTFSDSENLAILIVFLVGIILTSLGLIALYIANIHGEVINRPMYVVRKKKI
ncbi:MAG: Glycosyl transferase [Candidatus Moranbacteria bacterium GW2011_GWE1_36_7]|nr:MAG: Glycosyl transferase [Candidatus Moranbacteria bacterium GW2011_GWD2_36_12]KKQ06838.1 MAG: Glycosyl transferase [Candidatus Moranbacteria bacterium GW2011_GWE2_36_40]KKQ15428.1 MAG: Glycosyl transferase [Candidatus Moranbacteria bacterium GW2011_GWE1_36_7]